MKFRIDDKVKYIRKTNPFVHYNEVGTIVNVERNDCPYKVLFSRRIWWCVEKNLVKVLLKNQQLSFNFME